MSNVYRVKLEVDGQEVERYFFRELLDAERKFEEEKKRIESDAGVFYGFGEHVQLELRDGAFEIGPDPEWCPGCILDSYRVTI